MDQLRGNHYSSDLSVETLEILIALLCCLVFFFCAGRGHVSPAACEPVPKDIEHDGISISGAWLRWPPKDSSLPSLAKLAELAQVNLQVSCIVGSVVQSQKRNGK